MSDRGRPPKPPSRPESRHDRPTWTVTRRERTEQSPLRSGSPFQSRTVTTTERVQIMQLPLSLTEQQVAPAELLALSPTANTSQSVSSTITTLQAEGTPVIGAITAQGVPLYLGIVHQADARHTTTIITTTTTTYRVLEVSDSDSMSDDFDMIEQQQKQQITSPIPIGDSLTIDMNIIPRSQSPQYVIVNKSESEAPLSPITRARMQIDIDFNDSTWNSPASPRQTDLDSSIDDFDVIHPTFDRMNTTASQYDYPEDQQTPSTSFAN
ncbi:unnamed protein product, partial [Auanema sp. JU1783]